MGGSCLAFTLAEVLIVLGIIGLIADMTIPSLVKSFQKIVLTTRMKHTLSAISQAVQLSEIDNGPKAQWDLGAGRTKEHLKTLADTYLIPYFNKVEVWENSSTNSYGSYGIILADGTTLAFELDGMGGEVDFIGVLRAYVYFETNDRIYKGTKRDFSRKDFLIDIVYSSSNRPVVFFNWCAQDRACMINHPTYGCKKSTKKNNRLMCGALIQYDGWKISEDYPW